MKSARGWVIAASFVLGIGLVLALRPLRTQAPPSPAAPEPGKDPWRTRARAELEAGRLDPARAILRPKLDGPDAGEAYAILAIVQLRAEDLSGAESLLQRARALAPDAALTQLAWGHLQMARGRPDEAQRAYTRAIETDRGEAEAYEARAAARHGRQEFAGAIEDADEALRRDPARRRALFTRAASCAALGDLPRALRDYSAYLAAHPDDAEAWFNRGRLHEQAGDGEAARRDWGQAVRLRPEWRARLPVE